MPLALLFPNIDPVAIQLGPLSIRWYALAYLGGIGLGWLLVRGLVKRPSWRLQQDDVDDLVTYATLGIVLGGRLGYVLFYQFGSYVQRPWEILAVWQGGMSFHGGLLGVVVAALVCARRRQLAFLEIADAFAVVTPIGLGLGRLANFVNGELWGRPAPDLAWGMVFPGGGPVPRHPSQLYEAALEGLVLLVVMLLAARRPWRPAEAGRLGGIFLTGYALARILCEHFREPDPQLGFLLGGTTMGQLLSLPMLLVGVAAILVARQRGRRAAVAAAVAAARKPGRGRAKARP